MIEGDSELSKWRKPNEQTERLKKIGAVLITGITSAIALNYFLIPANVFSAGMNGIAQIIAGLTQSYYGVQIDTGALIFILNIPIFILSYLKLGKEATFYSFVNVACVSLTTMILPVHEITDNILLAALVGGVFLGIGGGVSLKMGFTTGGMDVISLVLSQTTGKTVGKYMLLLNGIIVFIAGFLFTWESALYTILSIYVMSQVVDALHTRHQKLTVMIITTKADQIAEAVSKQLVRGMTFLPSIGGYSRQEGNAIMMVITRYELYDLEQIIQETDQHAFVNIMPTKMVLGHFANEEDQKVYRSTGSFPEAKKKK